MIAQHLWPNAALKRTRVGTRRPRRSIGTKLNIVQEGVPEVIPPESCYLGWQESLILLAKLVEAEIQSSVEHRTSTRTTSLSRAFVIGGRRR